MPRIAKPLGALQIKNLNEEGYHAVGTVPGLYLQVKASRAKSWVMRAVVGRKRKEIGLGGYPAVPLAAAHDAARQVRAMIDGGVDPIAAKQAAKSALLAAQLSGKTFAQCADACIAAYEPGWKNPKHGQQWRNTLRDYAMPVLGPLLVRDVTTAHVLKVLEPIWSKKPETASRVRGRVEAVLNWAKARGLREGENPACWKGHLDKLLASPKKMGKRGHHDGVGVAYAPTFLRDLRGREGIAARGLELLMLSAVRSANVRKATWAEFDLEQGLWVIPGESESDEIGQRMKSGKSHRVPLPESAIKLLKAMPRIAGTDLVFPGVKNQPLSDASLLAVMKRMQLPMKATPHGLRADFKTWAEERAHAEPNVIEAALAHAIADKVEAAYMRGDWLEKRKRLMQQWDDFLARVQEPSTVVPMPRRKAA